jgi:MscS family membrane protein
MAMLTLILAGGCATLPENVERPESYAYTDTENTAFGSARAEERAAHPEESGFRLLGNGLDAFVARIDIENIARRPHIRRLTNMALRYDTPLEKIEKAVRIITEILDNHEGMDPEFPPRVYFNEFNRDSLNIIMLYWYHPPAYWDFLAFNQRVNAQIMREFEQEGIKFALPSTRTYLTQDDGQSFGIASDPHMTDA